MASVVVCGASRGIGLELAKAHLAAGDRVFAMARDPAGAPALAQAAAASNGHMTVHPMDVASDGSVAQAARATQGAPIDILYAVAGVSGAATPALDEGDWEDFDRSIEVMLKGPLRVVRAFLPQLAAGSKIVAISSQMGASAWPFGGHYGYVAAKAGLNRLMRSLAIDLKDRGIVVGIVHPGYVQTDMGGPGADITPQESAAGLLALARNWTIERTGEFYDWDGTPRAW